MCEHNFVTLGDGTLVGGEHYHLYRCLLCGRDDIKIEGVGKW